MTARCLSYEEWSRLPQTLDPMLMEMRPGSSRVCVVENDQGDIVARWLLRPVLMAESLWVAPECRKKVTVGRKIWRLVHQAAAELGFSRVVSYPFNAESYAMVMNPKLKATILPHLFTFPVQELK